MDNQQIKGKCPGNCIGCSFYQRSYCSTQMSRNTQDMVLRVAQELAEVKAMLREFIGVAPIIEPSNEIENTNISTQDGAENSPVV